MRSSCSVDAVKFAELRADLTATTFFLAAVVVVSWGRPTVRGLCVREPAVLLLGVVAPPPLLLAAVVVLRRPARVRCCGL